MNRSIPDHTQDHVLDQLHKANLAFHALYPGDRADRQAVHTVYGGANLFRSDTVARMGKTALACLDVYAPDAAAFATAIGMDLNDTPTGFADTVYERVREKLGREPVEDFRIDFEDGYGNRTDDEEDATAIEAADEVAVGMQSGSLSPFIGIRIKPFTEDMKARGVRTLDLFLTRLSELTDGTLPENFVVMLPKVSIPEQVTALVDLLEAIEANTQITPGALRMEMMVETTQSMMTAEGRNPLMSFVNASRGRLVAAAFGTYDYTASCNITARHQAMSHPVCDFAHHMTRVALGGTGIHLTDGATNVMPVGPHRGEALSAQQQQENRDVVHNAWALSYRHIRHSLWNGFYQGWDLNPAQLPVRYAAVYAFFLESYADAAERLNQFVGKAARVTLTGDVFDDAATGQGLLNYFLAALNCGAISEADTEATGLSLDEIRSRSFLRILEGRRNAT